MLKHLKFLMLLVLPFSLAMTSCSDDDNENLEDGNEETSLLVGSWQWDDEVEPEIWTFYANGTCKCVLYSYQNDKEYKSTGNYQYDSSTGILLMSVQWEDLDAPKIYKYKVLSISSLELTVQEVDSDGYTMNPITLTRKI